jgi:3-ketosteroid 9alpha-monooxygenase subunit B
MQASRDALDTLKVPAEQVHLEVFKSLDSDPFAAVTIDLSPEGGDSDEEAAPPATVTDELDGETPEVAWPRHVKLLDLLLDKGLDAPFSCREGHCGACACVLKNGNVSMEVNDVLEPQDLAEGLILACQAHPETDSVEVTYDE